MALDGEALRLGSGLGSSGNAARLRPGRSEGLMAPGGLGGGTGLGAGMSLLALPLAWASDSVSVNEWTR